MVRATKQRDAFRSAVRTEVVEALRCFAAPDQVLSDRTSLANDLDLGPSLRRAFASVLTRISTRYGGRMIAQHEAESLRTLGAAVRLVVKDVKPAAVSDPGGERRVCGRT